MLGKILPAVRFWLKEIIINAFHSRQKKTLCKYTTMKAGLQTDLQTKHLLFLQNYPKNIIDIKTPLRC